MRRFCGSWNGGSSSSTAPWARCSRPTAWPRRTSGASGCGTAQGPEGQQRPAEPDAAGHRRGDPPGVPRGRRRHRRDQHLQRQPRSPWPTTGPKALAYELNVAAARAARRAADARHGRAAGRPRFVAGASARRTARPRCPATSTTRARAGSLRRAGGGLPRAGARPRRRRRRPAAGRDGLRHAEREGRALRDRARCSRSAAPRCRSWRRSRSPTAPAAPCPGRRVEAFWNSISHADLLSRRASTARSGRSEMRPYVEELARLAPVFVSCYPNAGLPERLRRLRRDAGAWRATCASSRRAAGLVNIVGGCCGTTPDHIRAIAEAVRGLAPRVPPARSSRSPASRGLEPLDHPPGHELRERRRAHQRHRLAAVREADPGGPVRGGGRRSRASRWTAAPRSSTSTWTRACSTPRRP